MNSTPKPLHVFRPGLHTATSGDTIEFSESDLAAAAAAYDPKKWRAPLVCGHPKLNAPAYGYVDALSNSAIGLEAVPGDVEPAFAELVNRKRYSSISASFWAPTAPGNPVPGVYSLRHVGFLGAVPPALKGLREPEFGASDEGVVEFGEWDDVDNAGLWRSLRDWIIGTFGLSLADKVVPSYLVSGLEQSAQQELAESRAEGEDASALSTSAFAEHQEPSVTPQDKARIEAENAALRQQLAAANAEARQRAAAARHAENLSFAEGLTRAGKLPPARLEMAVATLDFMASQEQVVEFGEGDAKRPLIDGFREFLNGLPVAPEFSEEVATSARAAGQLGVVSFAAPGGYGVDGESAALHAKALAYQADHPDVSYVSAVAAVQKQG